MTNTSPKRFNTLKALRELPAKLTVAAIGLAPALVWAQDPPAGGGGGDFGGADGKVTTFLSNLTGLLDLASIAVVTIAIVFAGYQIAFAHKRISDVAPILIGGLLVGAAGQLAKMVIGDPAAGESVTMIVSSLASYA